MTSHPSHADLRYREVTVELTSERDDPRNRDLVGHYSEFMTFGCDLLP